MASLLISTFSDMHYKAIYHAGTRWIMCVCMHVHIYATLRAIYVLWMDSLEHCLAGQVLADWFPW